MIRLLLCSLCIWIMSAAAALARDFAFESKPTRTRLLELFTSEGCSSCPPAEAAFSRLQRDPALWRDFVPVAFHVDYWDSLGWRDPFASKLWTQRQRIYAAAWNTSTVYTPGFVLDGREWREASVPASSREAGGVLKAAITDDRNVVVTFQPATALRPAFDVYMATLGFGLETNVRAGENRGRKLLHDFVVLSLSTAQLAGSGGDARFTRACARCSRKPGAVAIWVTESGSTQPIQATGGWLH
ncbi:MAG: DUF1223 domain-containing protein [Chthoniobacterales bacterium]|nr:DUF1223 domain-containing protein [Chthoniobacterales bacterium]